MKGTAKVSIDLASLKAARAKIRQATAAAEGDRADLHSLYKAGQFLRDAVGERAWLATEPIPDAIPEWMGGGETDA